MPSSGDSETWLCMFALTDKSRLKDAGGDGGEDEFTRPHDLRGCAEAHPVANGKRLVPAVPAFRVLPASAGPVQTVADVSCDLAICRRAVSDLFGPLNALLC